MNGHSRALEVLHQIMSRRDPDAWQHGTWLGAELTASERAVLDKLDPCIACPTGGRAALYLRGWDHMSIWGYDPPMACYFASLWRNRPFGREGDDPDIWINGWDTIDGRPFTLTSTHMLAREIAAAAGRPLEAVCAALADSQFR